MGTDTITDTVASPVRTLIIVHLSSIDSYAATYGRAAAYSLARRLSDAAVAASHCIVTNQRWAITPDDSGPRDRLTKRLDAHPSVLRFRHDEATDGWVEPMARLAQALRPHQGDDIIIGGVWLTADSSGGCVVATAEALRAAGYRVTIDPSLCGVITRTRRGRRPTLWRIATRTPCTSRWRPPTT